MDIGALTRKIYLKQHKRISKNKNAFKTHENRGGKWTFNVVSGNNKVVASSQSYKDKNGMNKGIKSVMTNAPKLIIK